MRPLAITSIGRDGEDEDVVSGRAKPRIYVYAGTLLATAENAMRRADALLDVLALSGVRTAFGEIVICRAISDGYIELAGGPSSASDLLQIAKLLREIAPDCLYIIDGALSRRSQAGGGVSPKTSFLPPVAKRVPFPVNWPNTLRIVLSF